MILGLQSLSIKFLKQKKWLESEMRVKLNPAKINQYAAEKKRGCVFPPPVVFCDPNGSYWVGDGFHRIEADLANGQNKIDVFLKNGTLKEAILHNLKANRESQGMPFAPGDISKSIKTMLTNKLFAKMTRKQISDEVGCSYSLVSKVALGLGLPRCKTGLRPVIDNQQVAEMIASGIPHKEVAKKLGVHERTIYRASIRSLLEPCPHCHGTGYVVQLKVS